MLLVRLESDVRFRYPPWEPFEHTEHGKDADPSFPNLLKDATVADITANIGAEVHGVQLSKLTDAGKDELALFVAQKKVVAFRDQDFADIPIKDALDFGGYFGRHHIHPTSGAPEGYPEVHLVHRGTDDTTARDFFEERTNSITWHSDVTYEKQPPGTTFLYLLDGPAAGGDTLFANQAAAYNRLSPEFRKRLHGLKVVHSGKLSSKTAAKRYSHRLSCRASRQQQEQRWHCPSRPSDFNSSACTNASRYWRESALRESPI